MRLHKITATSGNQPLIVPPQITPRLSSDISNIGCSEDNTSNWIGESLIELLSNPLDGAGLGDRVRSVDSPS